MSIRTKTKRRLAVLLGLGLLLGGTLGGAYFYLQHQQREQMRRHRAQGLAAAEAGNHHKALDHLGKYVEQNKDDARALYQYGVARREIEQPRNSHLAEALNIFQAALEADSDHAGAQNDLLKLYTRVGYNTEARDLAERVLDDDPANAVALRAKAVALGQLQEFDAALTAAQRLVEAEPDNLRHRLLRLTLMKRADRPNEQIIAHAQERLDRNPGDPRFQMLLGYAHGLAGDREKAGEWLEKAAAHDLSDTEFIQILVAQLDRLGSYETAMSLLTDHPEIDTIPELRHMLIRRLWQSRRYDQILQRLDDLKPGNPDASSELLVFKALAHIRRQQTDEAEPIVSALADRGHDVTADAWVPVLRRTLGGDEDEREPSRTVQMLREALEKKPGDPYLRHLLAKAYRQLGEPQLAIEQWRRVTEQSPSWALPHTRIAEALNQRGKHREAAEAAREATRRAPRSTDAVLAFANAWAGALQSGELPAETSEQLRQLLSSIREAAPQQQQALPLLVEVVARSGDSDQARRLAESALADTENPPSEETLIQLAEVSHEQGLGLTDRCLTLSQETYGLTPGLAYARAAHMTQTQSYEAAQSYFQNAAEEHGDGSLQWRTARARLLDRIDAPEAAELWITLADNHPGNLSLQRLALEADAVRGRRDFVDRVIERVKLLGGEEGLTWRIARARWLLDGEVSESEAAEAISLLNEVSHRAPSMPEPRLLLASAYRHVDNLDSAIDRLESAAELRPDSTSIRIRLARLYQQTGRHAEVRDLVQRLVQQDQLAPRHRRQAAALLATAGETEDAIELLRTDGQPLDDPRARLMLAQLYFRSGNVQQANELYKAVVRQQPTLDAIREYANFLGELGQHEQAMQVLAPLEQADLPAGARPIMLAEYHRQRGQIDTAADHYRSAIDAVPDNRVLHTRLVGMLLANGRLDAALTANSRAREAFPDHEPFNTIHEHSQLLRRTADRPALHPLLEALLADRTERRATLQALRVTDRTGEDPEAARNRMLSRLRSLADEHPRFLELQLVLADLYLNAGRYREAASISNRAMDLFPTRPGPAERATRALIAQEQWSETLSTARRWRSRTAHQPINADLAIAEAQLNLDEPQVALDRLEPYRAAALENPQRYQRVLRLHLRGLVRDGRAQRAASILEPLLADSPGWRRFFSTLAMRRISDPETAADWLKRLESTIPDDAIEERVALAGNWYSLGQRADDRSHRQRSLDILRDLADRSDADASTITRYAMIAHNEGKTELAERQYRRALELQPDATIPLNNLAVLLAEEGRNLEEAERLARRALEKNPEDANLHDSLAEVLVARGQHAAAADQLERAIELDPETVRWHVNLAGVHADRGDREAARSVLAEIELLQPDPRQLPAELRNRLQEIRRSVNETQAAGS